jgi:hypothetical protein
MSDHPVEPPCNVRYVSRFDPHYFPHFDPPHPSSSFSQVMYDVSGETRAENHLIIIAQDELLLCLLADERVISRLDEWTTSVDLPQIVHDVADFLDRVAKRYSLSRRADLGRIPRPPHISVEDFLPEWRTLQDRLYATYRRGTEVLEAACGYVRDELQQPWPWLAYRLAYHLFQQAWERAEGVTMVRQRAPYFLYDDLWEPKVQPFRSVFETRPWETVSEARKRRMAEAMADCANLQPAESESRSLPKGKVRTDRELKTRRNTRWLYRHLICEETKYRIALSYHAEQQSRQKHKEFPSCSCEGNVRRGIDSAQALLHLTPYCF